MKKLLVLISGLLVLGGTAVADCGACGDEGAGHHKKEMKQKMEQKKLKAKGMKKEAECKMEAKEECAADKAKEAKMKAGKTEEDMKDNASDKAKEKRKKWWKFGFGDD